MKVKRFKGKDFKKVMEEIRRVLGDDALILSTRTKGDEVEVLAAVDFDWEKVESEQPRTGIDLLEKLKESDTSPMSVSQEKREEYIEKVLIEMEELKNAVVAYIKRYQELEGLRKELTDIKRLLAQKVSLFSLVESLDEEALVVISRLKEMEVEDSVLEKLISEIKKNELLPAAAVAEHYISSVIKTAKYDPEPNIPNIFVGPTGVGKTTTIAKVASLLKFFSGKEIATVSIDTYRIGATDQMRIYSDLIGVDFYIANTPSEFSQVMNFVKGKVVLVDTAGRSPKDEVRLNELSAFLSEVDEYKLFLLIPYGARFKDALKIVESFSLKKPDGLILTKLDETDIFGLPLNLSFFLDVPILYVTTGQRVPEDIEVADAGKITRLILDMGE